MRKEVFIIAILLACNFCKAQPGALNIGTINAGDSIVIKYNVTINNPLVPPGTTQITNQGTVTATGGINIVTDDPDSAPGNDPTITNLNSGSLPVTLTQLKAYEKNNQIELSWKVVSEIDVLGYEIEKSTDGRIFTRIGTVAARGGNGTLNYGYIDQNPVAGYNAYRLRMVDIDGQAKYSMIVIVLMDRSRNLIAVYPNPVPAKVINVQFNNMSKGKYELNLFNNSGQVVYNRTIDHIGGSASELILLPASLAGGVYYINIKSGAVLLNKLLVVQ